MENLILLTDSYKVSQWRQYPALTTNVYSYSESRGGLFPETTFFGLQYLLQEYLSDTITYEDIIEAEDIYAKHFGSPNIINKNGWFHILEHHKGKLPLVIKAIPEGTTVNNSNAIITVENTCHECYWVTNYMESLLVQNTWYPITVATRSREVKKLILKYLELTGDPATINFKLHDFGFRGVSSVESAKIGGAAHLANFMGTDNVPALSLLRRHYSCDMAGFSIPASEHSTITSWGQLDEVNAFRNMIEKYGNMPLYACVSDSYDIYRAVEKLWGTELKAEVLNAAGTLVVRPDSGTPHEVVLKCLQLLADKFGYSYNTKRYKVLNPKVRLIQGDGVTYESINKILSTITTEGFSTDNLAFGSGGWLLQIVDRDTQRMAFKCSSVIVDGQERGVFKCPVTDKGKHSKAGRFGLVCQNGIYKTVDADKYGDILETVFKNGEVLRHQSLDNIRERIDQNIKKETF
jgi:nicotinamide phosphoribosyltransferase